MKRRTTPMREILATRGTAIELHIGDKMERFSDAEAEQIVTQLLAVLPYPEAVRMLWVNRSTPRGKVVHYYKHDGAGAIASAGYKALVTLGDKLLFNTKLHESPISATDE